MHDPGLGVDGLLVEVVDALPDEHRLAGQVGVVGAGLGTGLHQGQTVLAVWADSCDDHPGALGHLVERGGLGRVDGQDGPGLGGLAQGGPDRLQLGRGASGQRDAGLPARFGEVLGGELADEARRAVEDDVEFALSGGHGANLPAQM